MAPAVLVRKKSRKIWITGNRTRRRWKMPTHALDLMRLKIDWQVLSRRQQCGTGTHLPAWMTCGASSGWPPTNRPYVHNFAVNAAAPPHPLTQVSCLSRLAPAVTAATVALPIAIEDIQQSKKNRKRRHPSLWWYGQLWPVSPDWRGHGAWRRYSPIPPTHLM